MKASPRPMLDSHVEQLLKQICATISARFPEATFEIGAHPTQRGAIIDVHVPTDDDFAVLELVNPTLDDGLLHDEIAIYVRALGPV